MLEAIALDGLRNRLMDPELSKAFAEAFTQEWHRLQGANAGERDARLAELARVRQQVERLVDALADGTPVNAVRGRLSALEARRLALEAEAAQARAPAPRLHPNLPEIYRQKVGSLIEALDAGGSTDISDLLRGLVDRVTLHPKAEGIRVEVRGELAAILGLAPEGGSPRAAGVPALLAEQMKMVAGTGFEPVTFRL